MGGADQGERGAGGLMYSILAPRGTPEAVIEKIHAQAEKWRKVIRASGIKAE